MHQTIIKAIEERRLMSFTYDNLPRVVEPHLYGVTHKNKEVLRCYQVDGEGIAPGGSHWLLIAAARIFDLTLLEGTFSEARPEYRRDDPDMRTIYAQI